MNESNDNASSPEPAVAQTETSEKCPVQDGTLADPAMDPHAYLNRNEFSSERFKIEVSGLPRYYGFGELKRLFYNKIKVNAHKMIPPKRGSSYMFVNFKSEEDRQEALQKINGYVWKNQTLSAKMAKPAEDPLVRKRNAEDVDDVEAGFLPNESMADAMRRVTTPWWNIPYQEQLTRKDLLVSEIFSEMKTGILNVNKPQLQNSIFTDCVVEQIKVSPVTEKYRSKCEFSIGYDPETKKKTVGFRLSSYKQGSVAVGPLDSVTHLPDCMLRIALQFQDFVRLSKLSIYNPETHQGCFRQLTVRATRNDDVMLVVLLNKKDLPEGDFEELKENLNTSFSTTVGVKSLYLKFMNDHGQADKDPPVLLFGNATVTENVLGLQFEISPEAFFQVNVPATEILYQVIGDLLEEQKDATLVDVCSGTGTIGISLASKCSEVLGVEMVSSAVEDARKNAEINSLSEKCSFFCGKAEDITEPVLSRAKSDKIIAVVDPPRSGLHQKVLYTLRKCEKIQTLIYVACNAKAAMKNFIDLCRPTSNNFRGRPFIPVKLIPVDLFPNSPHFELVIVFKRLSSIAGHQPE